MDVALFGASVIVSTVLPQRITITQTEQSYISISLFLSLSLFSLTLADAIPDSWLMILSNDDAANYGDPLVASYHLFTIARVYWILLWSLCMFLLVGLPCVTGAAAAQGLAKWMETTIHVDRNDKTKNPLRLMWRKLPWWVKIVCQLVGFMVSKLFKTLRQYCGLHSKSTEPILVMTVKDDEMKRTGSDDEEWRPIATPTNRQSLSVSSHRNVLVLGCVAATGSTIVVVSSIGPLVVHASNDSGFLSIAVSWLCAIGLVVAALLNGFGSVSMPYSCLVGLYLEPIQPEAITRAEAELQSVLGALKNKMAQLNEMSKSVTARSTRLHLTPPSSGNAFSFNLKGPLKSGSSQSKGTIPSFSELGDEFSQRRRVLQNEIEFLVVLCKDLKEDIDEMRQSQAVAAEARTTAGTVRSWLGVVFSLVLIVRLVSAGVSIWGYNMPEASKRPRGDFITTTLLWLTGHNFVDQKDFTMLSQFVSLVLTAILSFSQIRTFLRTIASVNRRLDRFYSRYSHSFGTINSKPDDVLSPQSLPMENSSLWGASGAIHSHLITSTMGCYFLSCIVLIKMMLPGHYSAGFSAALGGLDLFTIHAPVVNSMYACSAVCTAAVLGMLSGIQRQNTIRHRDTHRTERGAEAC